MSVFIIAEAGVNHNGSLKTAKKLIDVAADSGANSVKFQTFKSENLVSKSAKLADYQKINSGNKTTQFDMIKKLELDINAHKELINYCKTKNIIFLSTPFDHDSIDLLNSLKLKIFKIPSGEITNKPYLEHIGGLKKEVILSTGMATLDEVKQAIDILQISGTSKNMITVLHANTEYPTPFVDVNLRAMVTIGKKFQIKYGYSDHTLGIDIPIAATALGASVIEKHFTLDRDMPGPDHKASLEPDDLYKMVNSIRSVEIALGSDIKQPSPSEIKNICITRKSIHLRKDIKAGTILTKDYLCMKRPGDGISPMDIDTCIGKVIKNDLPADTKLKREDFK